MPAPGFPVGKLLLFLRRLWWVPAVTFAFALAAAGSYILFWMPPTFVSSSTMWETEKLRLPEGALFTEDPQSYLGTQTELIKSGRLWQMALARLQASGSNAVPLDKEGKPLTVKLNVTQVPKSTLFTVTASSSRPDYARTFLDALMNEYLDYKKTIRKTVSGDTLASISEQVQRLERDLKSDQDALTDFQRSNNLAVLQEEGTIAGTYLAKLKTQLSDYRLDAQLLEATALEQQADSSARTNSLPSSIGSFRGDDSASSSPGNTERQTTVKDLELLKIQRDALSKYLRPKHPKIVKLDEQIAQGQRILDMYRSQNREQLLATRQALKLKTDSVLEATKEWEVKVTEANRRIAEAERLKLNINRAQSLYDRLIGLLQNVDISRNIDQETLAILEPASAAKRSYKHELSTLALSVFGGIGLGIGIIALVMVRDDRFTSLVEVNKQLGDSTVGQVPDMPQIDGKTPLLLGEGEDRHIYAESYRSLRSALMFLATDGRRPKTILITSALPGEGKSTVAANLARTMAMGGSRVLLVDGDLRKGVLHELLGLQREPGLAELLRQPDAPGIIQTNCEPNLAFIASGKRMANPGDLFLGAGLEKLLSRWREQYDYVLIDSSPVFAADDATTLAPKMDGTLFVVRRQFAGARQVREALEQLQQRQAGILGVVFNRADTSHKSYHYYKYAEYYAKDCP